MFNLAVINIHNEVLNAMCLQVQSDFDQDEGGIVRKVPL